MNETQTQTRTLALTTGSALDAAKRAARRASDAQRAAFNEAVRIYNVGLKMAQAGRDEQAQAQFEVARNRADAILRAAGWLR